MKVFYLMLVMVLAVSFSAVAEVTEKGHYYGDATYLNEILNEQTCVLHNHEYTDTWRPEGADRRRNPIGLGTDLLLWDNQDVNVSHKYRFDWSNDEHVNYFVVGNKKSLWDMFTGK